MTQSSRGPPALLLLYEACFLGTSDVMKSMPDTAQVGSLSA
jgi:hypothetical protein